MPEVAEKASMPQPSISCVRSVARTQMLHRWEPHARGRKAVEPGRGPLCQPANREVQAAHCVERRMPGREAAGGDRVRNLSGSYVRQLELVAESRRSRRQHPRRHFRRPASSPYRLLKRSKSEHSSSKGGDGPDPGTPHKCGPRRPCLRRHRCRRRRRRRAIYPETGVSDAGNGGITSSIRHAHAPGPVAEIARSLAARSVGVMNGLSRCSDTAAWPASSSSAFANSETLLAS
jgi:hypothetical protein